MVACESNEFLGCRYYGPILLYLADHDGCMMSDLYQEVTGGRSMPDVLDGLEKAGAIARMKDGRVTRINLTAKGTTMGHMLKEAEAIFLEA